MVRKGMREKEPIHLPNTSAAKTELSSDFLPKADHSPGAEFHTPQTWLCPETSGP